MISFNTEDFILKETTREIVVPVTRDGGIHFSSTEKIIQAIPSLRGKITEACSNGALSLNDIVTVESDMGIKFHLLVTKYRSEAPENMQYIVTALNKLSVFSRHCNANFAIAPLVSKEQTSNAVMQNIVKGLFQNHPADIVFYLGE